MSSQPYAYIPRGEGEPHEFDWGEIVWTVSGPLKNSASMTFGRVTIKSGMSNPGHTHGNCDEVLYLISGELEHRIGDETVHMKPGDTLFVPAGYSHQARTVSDEDAVMVVSYSSADREITPDAGQESE